jgi:hypothetical protein
MNVRPLRDRVLVKRIVREDEILGVAEGVPELATV